MIWTDHLTTLAQATVAVLAGTLPARSWEHWPRLPIRRAAVLSALVPLVLGLYLGGTGFVAYARRAAAAATDATLELAARQNAGQAGHAAPVTTLAPQALSALSPMAFVFFTPLGLAALYLAGSGIVRVFACIAGQPLGDPLATMADAAIRGARSRGRATRTQRAREREEGPEVPDRLFTGEGMGLSGVDLVVIASRRKPEWTAGTFVLTTDAWYRLGQAFDVRRAGRLRTAYPLTLLRTREVLRRGVRYELPPLEAGRPPSFAPDRTRR